MTAGFVFVFVGFGCLDCGDSGVVPGAKECQVVGVVVLVVADVVDFGAWVNATAVGVGVYELALRVAEGWVVFSGFYLPLYVMPVVGEVSPFGPGHYWLPYLFLGAEYLVGVIVSGFGWLWGLGCFAVCRTLLSVVYLS